MSSFSERHGLRPPDPQITVTRASPDWLRHDLISIFTEFGISFYQIREWLLDHLLIFSSPFRGMDEAYSEVRNLLNENGWFVIFDMVEWAYTQLTMESDGESERFANKINRYFRAKGVGWQLVSGNLEIRGSQVFEETMHTAIDLSKASGRSTTESELREALQDLSHRPDPKVSGAIQHAMTALECLAKDISKESNLTLGEWIKKHRDKFPKPLDSVVDKLWGYASENARHLTEGTSPSVEEAELVIGLVGAFSNYLIRKNRR